MKDLFKKMVRYAPDGTDGGGEVSGGSETAVDASYADQFGAAQGEAGTDKPLDLDKIKPLYEAVDYGDDEHVDAQVVPENNEEPPTTEPPAQEQKVPTDDYAKLKSEYEDYKRGEEQRFNQFYANLKAQEQAQAAVVNTVDGLFNDENFKKEVESVETGADLAKLTMKKTVEMMSNMLRDKLAPIYNLAQAYQEEQNQKKTMEVLDGFRKKFGAEADRVLTANSPENKAVLAKLQTNPNLSLEEAFLLVKPQFVQNQVQSEVKKAISEKRAMALAPSAGKTTAAGASKIETPRDAMMAAIREIKNRDKQD